MSIIIVYCKLNRYYRRALTDIGVSFEHEHNYPLVTEEHVLDDLDNMLSGCAFE